MFQQVSTVDKQEDKQTNKKILTERTLQEKKKKKLPHY